MIKSMEKDSGCGSTSGIPAISLVDLSSSNNPISNDKGLGGTSGMRVLCISSTSTKSITTDLGLGGTSGILLEASCTPTKSRGRDEGPGGTSSLSISESGSSLRFKHQG